MEGVIALLMPIAIVWIVAHYRHKTKALGGNSKADQKQLQALKEERKQLEARVQNLESIVCSVDLELNARLNRLAAQQSAIGALPPAGTAPTVASAPAVSAPPTPQPGTRVAGRYTIEREIGRGGMGAVYLAKDEQLGERVALKVISQQFTADPAAAAERFRREVAAARKVTHPNVIRIHDLVEDGDRILLSMEYVDGMTLATHLGRAGSMRIDEARFILGQICDGLAAAHSAGVVHRDLKPGNVLLGADKRVKLIDFGLAKASFLAGMTATGLIVGTPEYMAPEQVKGLPCDTRTDLYAVGALAYHLLTGRPPFTGETPIAIGFAHVAEPPRPAAQLRADIPTDLDAAILKALEKEPGKRFLDATELKRALGA